MYYLSLGSFPIILLELFGAIFTKGLTQVRGLTGLYFYTKVKPKTWQRPFCEYNPRRGKNTNTH